MESGEGLTLLKSKLKDAALEQVSYTTAATSSTTTEFRLPIDRAFTIAGAGVVVTGTIHSGTVSTDQSLTLYPSMKTVRVKSVRAQDKEVAQAGPGDRCALNLAGVDIAEVARGEWLASDVEGSSREFSLQLTVLEDFPRPIRHWLPVHIYHATSHSTGRIALLSQNRVQPGATTLVELVTDEPLLLRRGDRLVLRDQGLDRTLGGGAVVSVQPATGRRRAEQRLQLLAADALHDPLQSLTTHLDLGAVALEDFRRNLALSEALLEQMLASEDCERVNGYAIRIPTWRAWQDQVLSEIERQHQADSALQGLKQSELTLPAGADGQADIAKFIPQLLAVLVADGKLAARAGRFLPVAHRVGLSEAEQTLFDRIEPLLNQPQPPSLGDMAKQFRLGVGDLAKRLHPLVSKEYLIRISDTRYYLPARLSDLADLARQLDAESPFTVRQYRDAAANGRNVAIEVLEHFDRIGFTKRDADTRRVIGSAPG